MTEIRLHTFGEKLIVSEKVTLASGNINSAELHVTLDEAWAAYPNISAIFETKEYIEPVERLMIAKTATEYVCIIPSEVLQKQGTLEIAIRGISNDGEKAKTSSYATYNIVKGASPGDVTLKPSMDLYQQYLAAMDEKTAPLFNAYKAAMDAKYAEVEADYKAKMATMSGDLVWTNSDIGADFPSQEIALDLSKYKRFVLVYVENNHNSNDMELSEKTIHEKDVEYRLHQPTSTFPRYRRFVVSDTKIWFSFAKDTASNASEENFCMVPYKLYGFEW